MPANTVSKRKVQRSPNYPLISLGEALGKLQVIYQHEKRSKAPYTVILKHLGYREQRGGVGGRTLSSLIQYGLLEQSRGECWVSDLGYTLLHYPETSPERGKALKEAAEKPTLFREILATYVDSLPSDDTLRSYLIKRGFNPSMTDRFIQVFRDTIQLAKVTADVYNVPSSEIGEMPPMEGQSADRTTSPTLASEVQVYSWALSQPRRVRAELKLIGRELRKEDIERLKKHLDLLEESFSDDV
jgi:hypothetical protein